MKQLKITKNEVDNKYIYFHSLTEYPAILNKIIDTQVIWHPEWQHFKIVRLNNVYLLFEKRKMLFHNTSIETVKNELLERSHFTNFQLSD